MVIKNFFFFFLDGGRLNDKNHQHYKSANASFFFILAGLRNRVVVCVNWEIRSDCSPPVHDITIAILEYICKQNLPPLT